MIPVAQLGSLSYTAPPSAFGDALTSFNYSVCDNNSTLSAAPSVITINVKAVEPPRETPVPAPTPLPFIPPVIGLPVALPLTEGIREINEIRTLNDIGASGSNGGMFTAYEPGIPVGRGLGFVPGQFVGGAVRDIQSVRALNDLRIAAINDIHKLTAGGAFDETRSAALAAQGSGVREAAGTLAPIEPAKPGAQAVNCIPDPAAQRLRAKPAAPRLALAPKPGADRFTDQLRQADRPAPVKPRAIATPKPAPRDAPICPPGTVPAPR